MEAIRVEHVWKRYRRRHLLHNCTTLKSAFLRRTPGVNPEDARYTQVFSDLSLSIRQGTMTGIIGENGSGKTTLLKLLCGILRPDVGTIHVRGRVSALIELGAGFHPDFSGRENVFMNAIMLGLSKREIRERFDSIVSFAELGDRIDDPVRTYSSGMFMRLGFAVAVHVDPDVLLIDEVLAVGDEAFGHKCQAKIEQLKGQRKTIVLVSHDLQAVGRWCTEAMWINDGAVTDVGEPAKVIDAYRQEVSRREGERLLAEQRAEPVAVAPEREEEPLSPLEDLGADRWGTREVEIVSVRLLGSRGEERYLFEAGDAVTVELEYQVHRPVERPVFGIGIFRGDGVQCYGSNTHIERMEVAPAARDGTVRCQIDRLDLVEGSYHLDVAVHAEDGRAYDYQRRVCPFAVRSSIKDVGVYRPPHRWVIN